MDENKQFRVIECLFGFLTITNRLYCSTVLTSGIKVDDCDFKEVCRDCKCLIAARETRNLAVAEDIKDYKGVICTVH